MMKTQKIHHIIAIVGCLPMVGVLIFFLADGGLEQFSPWAKDLYFDFRSITLPILLGTLVCLVNAALGLSHTSRSA